LYCGRVGSITYNPYYYERQTCGGGQKIAAGICGILLGAVGIHKFILGYTKEGVIMALVTVLTLGFGGFIMGLIGFIEGILYLTKSDEEFVKTYVAGKKGWF
jgi:TM2 domain-containing membrane protein YozV